MLDFNAPEFLVVGIVALLVIGPKDLPKAMRFVGKWVGKASGVARQFRSGFDTMVREAELAELEEKWAEENARIMREHPPEKSLPAPVYDPNAEGAAPASTDPKDSGPVMTQPPAMKPEPTAPKPKKAPAQRKPTARKAAAKTTTSAGEATAKPARKPRTRATKVTS